MKQLKFESFDKTEIFYCLWDNVEKPKGLVQIIHGMAEYVERYDAFAKFLNSKGYIVFGDDHRAHGNTAGEKLGVGQFTCFDDTIKDLRQLGKLMVEKYSLPLNIFGHSYGSFLSQRFIQLYSNDLNACVLSGSAYMFDSKVKFGIKFASFQGKLFGAEKPAKLIGKMSFGAFSKPFKDSKLTNRWLSRDNAEVEKYNAHHFCGHNMSIGFQKSFMSTLPILYKAENLNKINKNLPMLILSGQLDPVGGKKGSLVTKLYETYKSVGIKNINMKLYENARHEILNETNREEVYNDVLDFYEKNTK